MQPVASASASPPPWPSAAPSVVVHQYIRRLSKATQEKLAEAQCVAEEALSSMSTIRSFAAENEERECHGAIELH